MMLKLSILLILICIVPLTAEAVVIQNPLEHNTFGALLGAIVGFLMALAIPIAVIMIVIAGIYFVTARGDPEKIKTAQRMLFWLFIGLIIIFSARAIIEVIEYIFDIEITT